MLLSSWVGFGALEFLINSLSQRGSSQPSILSLYLTLSNYTAKGSLSCHVNCNTHELFLAYVKAPFVKIYNNICVSHNRQLWVNKKHMNTLQVQASLCKHIQGKGIVPMSTICG